MSSKAQKLGTAVANSAGIAVLKVTAPLADFSFQHNSRASPEEARLLCWKP